MPVSLVCPACRDGAPSVLVRGPRDATPHAPDVWRCDRCHAHYPHTLAPVVASPLAPFVRAVAEAHNDPDTLLALAPWLPDDDVRARALQRAAVATRAHWGDRVGLGAAWNTFSPMLAAFSERVGPKADLVELGCGAGRVALELATPGRHVVALDSDPVALAQGLSVRDHGAARLPIRRVGARYDRVAWKDDPLRGRDVTFVLGDALAPPLPPHAFDGAVALNLLDNVSVPTTLLGQLHALVKPGGWLLLSTPFAWDVAQTEDGERIGGAPGRPFGGDPEEELAKVLDGRALGAPWRFEPVAAFPHVAWTLRRDDRLSFTYDTHVVLARALDPD